MKQLKKSFGLMTAIVVTLTVSCQTQHELVKPIHYNFLEDLDPDSVLMLCPPPSAGPVSSGGLERQFDPVRCVSRAAQGAAGWPVTLGRRGA